MLRKSLFFLFVMTGLFWQSQISWAVTPPPGEEALFTTSVAPDALIVLDLSGSMAWNPAGDDSPYGASLACTPDTTKCSGSNCSGGFCTYAKTNCSTPCSRLAIAKRALFDLLDDNDDNTINSQDEGSLGVRVGYMRFYNCSSSSAEQQGTYSYSSGCNSLVRAIGSKYSLIFCASNTSCTITSGSSASSCINGEKASGGTPLASALYEAKLYLDAHKAQDSAAACRQKFVILVTDGSDTYACGGSGAECQQHQYKRRREAVAKAKALADAGYKVFVIGFGSAMPSYLQNTLNWMAYYGGTDNPNQANSSITTAYDPSAVSSCATDSAAQAGTCYDESNPGGVSVANFRAASNDPGYIDLSGYAFLTADADALAMALKTAINLIREATYSFSQASIQSSRTQDENYLYEGSFEPISGDPFWRGHLKKYQIESDGTVGDELWDAGNILQATSAGGRNIKTYKSGSLINFTTANITPADVGVTTTAERDAVVGYIRGESAYNPDATAAGVFKLGDVFRSTPITIGTPSPYFDDLRDANNAFATHRANHVRTSASGNRLIVVGANDGQLHAFKTSNGSEAWSFIPPNLLPKLKNITHSTHPTSLTHQYFVDGTVTAADVWLGTGDGLRKNSSDWKTMMIFGEGRGGTPNLWSSSSSCSSGFSPTYSSSYPYYCGYYALDLNDSLNPAFMWLLSPSSAQAPYLGDPWSKVMVGRVRYSTGGQEVEKWVGFMGAGYNASDCSGGGSCDTRGKGFFVVDLGTGAILWSYTRANNATMDYSIAAGPAIVDTDNDGFIDTAYIGDLGGSVWRFKFCRSADMPACSISNWTGGRLYEASTGNIRPIFTIPAVAKDAAGNLWVYWGTGDKTDPTASNAQEKFFGVKDNDRTTTYTISDFDNITSAGQTYDPTTSSKAGYYINLAGQGEKILADPTVFGGVVYFTTYTPPSGSDPCAQGGSASLYAISYTTGGGILGGGARSTSIGSGIPSAPILSLKPPATGEGGGGGGAGGGVTPDLYVTVSGGGGIGASTFRVNVNPPGVSNRTNILYWRDRKIQ